MEKNEIDKCKRIEFEHFPYYRNILKTLGYSDYIKPCVVNHKLQLCLINNFSHYSFRKLDIEHLLTLTDSFMWEELPTRDPDTGYLTTAGHIPRIQSLTKYTVLFSSAFHIIQSTVRIITSHETIYPLWFPIDTTRSPTNEIINVMQVCTHS